jgi:hypothetical protein
VISASGTPGQETVVETPAFLVAVTRMLRAAGRRVARSGDEVDLGQLVALEEAHRDAIQTAVDGLRARGYSWAYIGSATGIKRSAAQERWGRGGNTP